MRTAVFLPFCLAVVMCSAAFASDYTVTSSADGGADSLRDIIENVLPGAGGDDKSIGFEAGQPIALTGGPIAVANKNLAVTGHAGGLDLTSLINDVVGNQLAAAGGPDAAAAQTEVDAIVGQAGGMTSISRPGISPAGGVFTWQLGQGNGQSLENLHVHGIAVTAPGPDWAVGAVAGGQYAKTLTAADPEYGQSVSAELGSMSGLVVNDIAVAINSRWNYDSIVTGGVIGARAHTTGEVNPSRLTAKIGPVSDSVFDGVAVTGTGQNADVFGGVIGAYSNHESNNHNPASPVIAAEIGGVRDSIFNDITITTAGNIADVGGGVISAYARSGDGCPVQTTIGEVTGSLFSNISVTTDGDTSYVYGGVIAAGSISTNRLANASVYKNEIGPITRSVFTGITVTTLGTNSDIYGGAVSADGGAASVIRIDTATLGDITGSVFHEIHTDARQSDAYGGAIYSTGLARELTISDSRFLNNSANSVSGGRALGGAIFIDTLAGLENDHTNKLTLSAKAGETTLFAGNTANGRPNSIHFGAREAGNSVSHAELIVATEAGGTVELRDPLSAYMNNDMGFGMEITGAGDFLWGGVNDLDTDGTTVRFTRGTRTTLLPDFQLNNFGSFNTVLNHDTLTVTFDSGSTIIADLDTRPREDDLAMFANRDGNDKAQFVITGTADVVPLLLTFNETEARWLVVDGNAATAAEENFNLLDDPNFDAEILTDGGKVYIAISNKAVPPVPPDPPNPPGPTPVARLAANDNPNVIRSYLSGALEDAWQRFKADNPGDVARLAAIFDELLASPQQQIAEAIVSGANEPFRYMANLAGQAGRIDAANCASADIDKKWRVWASGYYDRNNQFEQDRYEDYDSHRLGQVVGASYDVAPSLRLRGYAGFADGRLDSVSLASQTKTESYAGGLSVVWSPAPCATLELDGAFGHFDNEFARQTVVGRHEADYGQTVWQVGARAARTFPLPAGRLTPFAGARFQRMTQDAVAETGGEWFSNRLEGFDANALYSELGFEWSRDFSLPGGATLTGVAAPSWRHDFGDREIATTGYFEGSPQRFKVAGPKRALDSFDLDLEIRARILAAESVTIDLDGGYTLNLNDRYAGHNWYAGMLVAF